MEAGTEDAGQAGVTVAPGRRRWGGVALASLLAALALAAGCQQSVRPAAQLITLYDLIADATSGGVVASTPTFAGFAAAKWIAPADDGSAALTPSRGFIDGQTAVWATTELWVDFDEVWAQPLYRATKGGVLLAPSPAEPPWVFSVGPRSLFYSPFWNVYGFEVPDGVDVNTILDTRAVIDLANSQGGFTSLGRRISSLAPHGAAGAAAFPAATYVDDLATWYGSANHRFVDFGDGGFAEDASAAVTQTPMFVFAARGPDGVFQPLGQPWVGGTRPLFSGPPALSNPIGGTSGSGGPGDTSAVPVGVAVRPSFGGLWRIHWVVPFTPIPGGDGRVTDCLPSGPCLTLDGQTAIESLGADRIFASEILVAAPLLQLGNQPFTANGGYLMQQQEERAP